MKPGSTPRATGTSGTTPTSGKMYKVEGPSDEKLKALVGKKVEVTGRIDPEGGPAEVGSSGGTRHDDKKYEANVCGCRNGLLLCRTRAVRGVCTGASTAGAAASASQARTAPEQQVTLTGCIQRETDYRRARDAGRGGVAGTGVGAGNEIKGRTVRRAPR